MIKKVDTFFVLLIFAAFAMSVLVVLMLSGMIYKHMVDISREGYNSQTCLSFIWSRVKNEDEAGKIRVDEFEGCPALSIYEEFGDSTYRTAIYYYEGWIHELFSEVGLGLTPGDGTPLIEVASFSLEELDYGLIRASTDSGSLLIYPRGR